MSPVADETEVQDSDYSPSPSPERDDIDVPSTEAMGDTLPIDDLFGETQALDDAGLEFDLKTQVVDDYEEGGGDDDGHGTDRTEELSDCDDRKVASFGVDCRGGAEGEEASRKSLVRDAGEKDVVVDSDAPTDDEDGAGNHASSASLHSGGSPQSNHGSAKRSFAAVRSASLRSSGLSAARNKTLKPVDTVPSYFSNGGYNSRNEDTGAGVQSGSKGIEVENLLKSQMGLTAHGSGACEMDLDHEIENIHKCTQDFLRDESKSRIHNPRVKKLFFEVTPPEREEITSKSDNITEEVCSAHLLASNHAVGGLSYIDSQEPSDLSQANALCIVDNFILVSDVDNDVGSFQELMAGKNDIVKTPATSNLMGAQSLAKKSGHGSPVGKEGIYEWIDELEDEGGGVFFTKTKGTFFESGARKSHSLPPQRQAIQIRNS